MEDLTNGPPLASTISSIANLTKTIVGAGMLAIPYAFRADSIIFGILIILLAGVASGFGLYLQFRSSKFLPPGHATFFSVCSITYPKLSAIFDLAIFLQCYGCCVSYLVIVGDLLPDLIKHDSFQRSQAILSSAIIIFPLLYLKSLNSLKYTSMLGLAAIAYLFLLVVAHFVVGDVSSELKGEIRIIEPLGLVPMLSTFSIIVFAYTGHQNMYSVINESKDKSTKNILVIIVSCVAISTTLFIIIGLAGYLTFGSNVSGNVILMYDNKLPNIIGRYATIFMVIFSLPLMFHPCRLSANNIVYYIQTNYCSQTEMKTITEDEETPLLQTDEPSPSEMQPVIVPFSNKTFIVLTTSLGLLAYVLALSISEFALVLSLVGATGSTTISFILPGLFGYKLLANDHTDINYKQDRIFKLFSVGLTYWGFLVMFVCVGATLFFN
ncbi:Avt7 protein [Saccharomycopsis crataegensis]|uniref:Avt7 protein n=1 Tax=Saccharomycopsis crataegensis TaxID=43959 RepID=A0AAV5QE01_9ASCO|nr:Avt7 protein [Saccharomycopsis crataegensis]